METSRPRRNANYTCIVVNDGQQRLTTMFLAYAAYCEIKIDVEKMIIDLISAMEHPGRKIHLAWFMRMTPINPIIVFNFKLRI